MTNHLLGNFEQFYGEVTGTGTNFKHSVGAFQTSLVDNRLNDKRILQNVLTKRLV
jgi:hypothetical protein